MPAFDLGRRLAAEFLGSTFLLATVVGSGIMGDRLAAGNSALALLGNAGATGAMLYALILVFASVSGAHFNPVVGLVALLSGRMSAGAAAAYVLAQLSGALAGTAAAHAMFAEPIVQVSTHIRSGPGQWFAECVATFGLIATILGTSRWRAQSIPAAVGLYITAGYWFTASTSFANPAVTVAREFTNTFSGIAPGNVFPFVVAQCLGAVVAMKFFAWLLAPTVAGAARRADGAVGVEIEAAE